jgi:PrtD family type I secretion system ABC transporter
MSFVDRALHTLQGGRAGIRKVGEGLRAVLGDATQQTDAPRTMRDALRACRPLFLFAALFGLATHLMLLTGPIYALQIYDRILPRTSEQTLAALTLLVVAAYLMFGLVDAIRLNLITKVGLRLERLLAERLILADTVAMPTGRQNANPIAALDVCRGFFGGRPVLMLMDLPFVPIFLVLILLAHGLLGMFAIAVSAVLVGTAALMARSTGRALTETERAAARITHQTRTLVNAARSAPAGSITPAALARWREERDALVRRQTRNHDRLGSFRSGALALSLAAQILALGLGAWLALRGEISPGGVLAVSLLLTRTLMPLTGAIGIWRRFHAMRLACNVVDAALSASPERATPLYAPRLKGEVVCDGVGFHYAGAKGPLIQPFTAHIPAGSFVGLIGDTGTGKSKLLHMLAGLASPTEGVAAIDGTDVRLIRSDVLARQVSYLPQGDVWLLDGTVRENIARIESGASDDAVSAARRARVHETILSLPDGYETRLGAGGIALSAGERRQVGLARAFFGRPRLMLLDEPAAHLDKAGEAALREALVAASRNGTTVLVATQRRDRLDGFDALLLLSAGAPPQFALRQEAGYPAKSPPKDAGSFEQSEATP